MALFPDFFTDFFAAAAAAAVADVSIFDNVVLVKPVAVVQSPSQRADLTKTKGKKICSEWGVLAARSELGTRTYMKLIYLYTYEVELKKETGSGR